MPHPQVHPLADIVTAFARLYLLKPLAILGVAIAAILPSAEFLAFFLRSHVIGVSPRGFAAVTYWVWSISLRAWACW